MKATQTVGLKWHSFGKLTKARSVFRNQPCVYMHTDKLRNPIRVGVASKGLESRYRGGTGYSLDAAMHDSGNLIFVAPMSAALCRAVELELIWRGRKLLHYNNVGKLTPPIVRLNLVHEGDVPRLDAFEA